MTWLVQLPHHPRREMNEEVYQQLEAKMMALSFGVNDFLKRSSDAESAPDEVFHFTDLEGLLGILRTKTLRATLASCSTDRAEVTFAIDRLKQHFNNRTYPFQHLGGDLVRKVFNGDLGLLPARFDQRVYLSSFCARADRAIHWLHYGRTGTGVAIGFDSKQLQATTQTYFCKVKYEASEQDAILFEVVRLVDEFYGDAVKSLLLPPMVEGMHETTMAHLLQGYVGLFAPLMKNEAFRPEEEWRLYSPETPTRPDQVPGEHTRGTEFKITNGRLVPFKSLQFEHLPITRIVLGGSCPIEPGDQALDVLLHDLLTGRSIGCSRSDIQLRP